MEIFLQTSRTSMSSLLQKYANINRNITATVKQSNNTVLKNRKVHQNLEKITN